MSSKSWNGDQEEVNRRIELYNTSLANTSDPPDWTSATLNPPAPVTHFPIPVNSCASLLDPSVPTSPRRIPLVRTATVHPRSWRQWPMGGRSRLANQNWQSSERDTESSVCSLSQELPDFFDSEAPYSFIIYSFWHCSSLSERPGKGLKDRVAGSGSHSGLFFRRQSNYDER